MKGNDIKNVLELYIELDSYEKQGIHLLLEEQESTPLQIAAACVLCEEHNYMRDYIQGEGGEVIQLKFHKIKG